MARRKRVAAYLRQPGRRGYRNGFPGRAASVVHERIRRAVRTARDNGILQTGAFGPVRLPRLRLLLVPDGTQIVKTLSEMMSQPTYIASCSFGKDSIATILLALEHDEPLDRVVFSEVMFDHARNISGEIPEHIGWIYDTAIPKLHDMGIHVDVVRAERDYCYFFANAVGGGVTRGGFTGSRSAANASSIGIAKSRPYENTSPKLLAVPCVQKRISCNTSALLRTNRDDLPNSRRTECRSWRNTATPSRWRNSFAPLTGYCRRSTRPGHAADAGSARTAKYNISSTCDAIIPNYGQNWSS